MNYHQDELTAEYNRQKVREDFAQIRLEQRSVKTSQRYPGLFTRTMHTISTWMISTGEELHDRFELPTAHSHSKRTRSFAH